jgi:hypothetical protein
MTPARAFTFGGGFAARLTVPARRQDVAVLARLVGFRGSSARFPLRDSPVGSAPSAGIFGAQQRRHGAESMAGQFAWGSEVLVT